MHVHMYHRLLQFNEIHITLQLASQCRLLMLLRPLSTQSSKRFESANNLLMASPLQTQH